MVSSGPAPQDSAGLRITRQASPPGLILAGDIDELTRPALLAELGQLSGGRVHLYLSAVEYCDLAGLRALLGLADAGPAPAAPDRAARPAVLAGPGAGHRRLGREPGRGDHLTAAPGRPESSRSRSRRGPP